MANTAKENKALAVKKIKAKYPGINDQGINAILANIELETDFVASVEKPGDWAHNRKRKKGGSKEYPYEEGDVKANLFKINNRLDRWAEKNGHVKDNGEIDEYAAEKAFNKLSKAEKNMARYGGYGGGIGALQTTIQSDPATGELYDPERAARFEAYVLSQVNPETGENYKSVAELVTLLEDPKHFDIGVDVALDFEGEEKGWSTEYLNTQTDGGKNLRFNPDNGINPGERHGRVEGDKFDTTFGSYSTVDGVAGSNVYTTSEAEKINDFNNIERNENGDPIGNQIPVDPSTGEPINPGGTGPGPGPDETGGIAQDPSITDDNIYSGGTLPEVEIEGKRGPKIEKGEPDITGDLIDSIEEKETDPYKVKEKDVKEPVDPEFKLEGTEPNQTDDLINSIEDKTGENIKVKEVEIDLTKKPVGPVVKPESDILNKEIVGPTAETADVEKNPKIKPQKTNKRNVPFNVDISDLNSLQNNTTTTAEVIVEDEEPFGAEERRNAIEGSTISGSFGYIGVDEDGVPQYGMRQDITPPTEVKDDDLQNPDDIPEVINDIQVDVVKKDENKGEDGSNTRENFENTPIVNPYFNVQDLLYVAQPVTTAPVGSAAQQEALPNELGGRPVDVEGKVDEAKLQEQQQINASFKNPQITYTDSQQFPGTKALNINGVTMDQDGGKQMFTYNSEHPSYSGNPARRTPATQKDIDKFKATVWLQNLEKQKQDLLKNTFSKKAKAEINKDYVRYSSKKDAELKNKVRGLDLDFEDNKVAPKLLKTVEREDYDYFDWQSYQIKDIQNRAKKRNAAMEKEGAVVMMGLQEKLNSVIKEQVPLVEDIISKDFRRRYLLGQFENMNDNQINELFNKELNDRMRLVQEDLVAQYNIEFENKMDAFAKEFKLPNLIDDGDYEKIDQLLDEVAWTTLPAREKRIVLDNIWKSCEDGLLTHTKTETTADMKAEFYDKYYDRIVEDEEGNPTPFALRDFANNVLDGGKIDKQLQVCEAYMMRPGNDPVGYDNSTGGPLTPTQWSEKFIALSNTKKFAEDIINNPEAFSKSATKNFFDGFKSLRGEQYVPFVGAIPEIFDLIELYKLSEKDPNSLSEFEKLSLNMYSMKIQAQEVAKKASPAYRRGKMLAEMIPYVGEFIATSGQFTSARAGAKKYLTEKAKQTVIKNTMQSTGKLVAVNRSINALSFIVGTASQAAANPQQYLKHFVENITPQTYYMFTDGGQEIVDLVDAMGSDDFLNMDIEMTTSFKKGTGMGSFEAAGKAYGVTWAEFFTERLGELVPMFGKYLRKDVMKNPAWMKKVTLGYYLRKMNLEGLAAKNHFMKNQVGWNGVVGEVFEEVVNQPLSSVIMGKPWYTGLATKNPIDGSLDFTEGTEFLKDMFTVTGVAQIAFGGINMGAQLVTGQKPPVLMIGEERYSSYSEFKTDLENLINAGKLGDQKVKITGNPVGFFEIEKIMKDSNNSENFDRLEYDKQKADRVRAREVEILNRLSSEEREEVVGINDELTKLREELDELQDPENKTKSKKKKIKETLNKIKELSDKKGDVIKEVAEQIILEDVAKVEKILEKLYPDGQTTIESISKSDIREIVMSGLADTIKVDGKQVFRLEDGKMIDIETGQEIVEEEKKQLEERIKEAEESEGFFSTPDKNGNQKIYINLDVASRSGNVNVAAHEFLHKVLFKTLNENPETALALGAVLDRYIKGIDPSMVSSSDMVRRLRNYRDFPPEQQAEESLTLFIDAIRSGDIKFNENVFTKLGDIIRRIMKSFGVEIKFKNGKDVYDFLKDFQYDVQRGKASASLQAAAKEGVEISGEVKKVANQYSRLLKKQEKVNKKIADALGIKYSKPIEDKKQNKDDLFDNVNRALDESMEMLHDTPNFSSLSKEEQSDVWNKLSKDDKLVIGYQIGLEWQLYTLAKIKSKLSPDAGMRIKEDGTKDFTLRNDLITNLTLGIENENGVPFMVNTWNPLKAKLTTHIYGLIPLRIPAAARQIPGFFEKQVGEEKASTKAAETKKDEEVKGTDIKLYKYPWVTPFNDKTKYPVTAKQIHLAIIDLIKQGKIDPKALSSYKDVRGVIPQEVIDMVFKFFGIKPKPGNLTKTDIKNAQLRIQFNYSFIHGNFPQGYNSDNKSTGTTSVLMTERPTKKNKLKEPKNVFYEELEVPDIVKDEQGNIIEVKTKAKRPSNLKIQKKIKNLNKEYILGVFGITETKGSADNFYRKEDNTSSRIRAAAMETAALFVNQAVVETIDNPSSLISQALNDGKAPFRYSKKLSADEQAIFEEGRTNFASKIAKNYDGSIESIISSLDSSYKNTISKKGKKAVAKEVQSVIKGYSRIQKVHSGVGSKKVVLPIALDEYINQFYIFENEDTAIFKFFTNMGLIKGVKNVGEGFLNINRINKARAHVINFFNEAIKNKQITVDQAVYYAQEFFKGMLAGATRIADGRIKVDVETGLLTEIPTDEWVKIQEKRKKEGKDKDKNRKQYFASVPDFVFNMLNEINGVEVVKNGKALGIGKIKEKYYFTIDKDGNKVYKPGIEQSYSENSETALNDPYGDYEGREKSSEHVRDAIELFMDYTYAQVKSKKSSFDYLDLAMMATSMGSGMTSIMRKAANLAYISSTALDIPVNKRGSKLEYEHMVPQVVATLRMLASYVNDGKMNRDEVFEGYHVAIIPSNMDTTLTKKGFRSKMPLFGNRYYNMFTFGEPTLDYLISLNPKHKGTDKEFMGKDFVEARELLGLESPLNHFQRMTLGKAYQFSKSLNNPTRGITVLDFDDTLATSKSLIEYVTKEGVKGTLTPAEYASTYQDLLGLGYKFDFSQFNLVVEGKVAPLFQKALKLQKKFGPGNMFVLTARPAESAPAIYEFLKANGLNIPLKNITGLANSTAEAKALWIAEKAAEGYNDFYFADDALQNVQAVKNMLDQFDVKSKVQQARLKFSKPQLDKEFNEILEDVTGIDAKKDFGKVKAGIRGKGKGMFRPFVPPGAEDFVGLLYNFMGKGKKGNAHKKWFEDILLNEYNDAYIKLNRARQQVQNEYQELRKKSPEVRKQLGKNSISKDYSVGDAIRVYLWNKAGYEIPGMSKKDQAELVEYVESKSDVKVFALALERIARQPEGYVQPEENWNVGNIASDLFSVVQSVNRKQFLTEWVERKNIIFSEKNLNKIEAAFGLNFREALEDMLYRMENGRSRPRGLNRLTNAALNFINAGVGTIMFFNGRSAALQTISFVNFVNYEDNNLFAFAKAYANFPQFIEDFAFLFNSDYLKQRRTGMKQDLNAAEMLESVRKSKNRASAMIGYILEKGFLPTKMADSFAIALGGSAFYRNRYNKLIKQGMSVKEAKKKAFEDFTKIAEETQQSSRPDLLSQQQTSLLGHFILAFANTPMQMTRLQKKAILDLINRRNTTESGSQTRSDVSNLSRILYYGFIQNVIFFSLQTALFALMFDDDESEEQQEKDATKKFRMANGILDSFLRGTGIYGAGVSMVKNYIIALMKENEGFSMTEASPLVELLNVSPPLGSKARKLVGAQRTYKFNKDAIETMPLMDIDNPIWEIASKGIEATTNLPTDRMRMKYINIDEAMNEENAAWQRFFLFMGWDRWGLGVEDRLEKTSKRKRKKAKSKSNSLKRAKQLN